jgi:hypothetical protein
MEPNPVPLIYEREQEVACIPQKPQIIITPWLMMWTASPQRHHSAKAWSQERHKEGDRP